MMDRQKETALADVMSPEFVRAYYYFGKYGDLMVMISTFMVAGITCTFVVEFEQRTQIILCACIMVMVFQIALLFLIHRLKSSVRSWYTRQQYLQDQKEKS